MPRLTWSPNVRDCYADTSTSVQCWTPGIAQTKIRTTTAEIGKTALSTQVKSLPWQIWACWSHQASTSWERTSAPSLSAFSRASWPRVFKLPGDKAPRLIGWKDGAAEWVCILRIGPEALEILPAVDPYPEPILENCAHDSIKWQKPWVKQRSHYTHDNQLRDPLTITFWSSWAVFIRCGGG